MYCLKLLPIFAIILSFANCNETDPDVMLFDAINNNNTEDVQNALNKGANPDFEFPNLGSALSNSCKKENIEIVRLLLSKGANVNVIEPNDETPLFFTKDIDIVKLLIDKGINTSHKNMDGNTILHIQKNVAICKLIIENNPAVVNLPNKNGQTPLMLAINNENLDLTNLFLSVKNQDLYYQDKNGETVFDHAAKAGYPYENMLDSLNTDKVSVVDTINTTVVQNDSIWELLDYFFENIYVIEPKSVLGSENNQHKIFKKISYHEDTEELWYVIAINKHKDEFSKVVESSLEDLPGVVLGERWEYLKRFFSKPEIQKALKLEEDEFSGSGNQYVFNR